MILVSSFLYIDFNFYLNLIRLIKIAYGILISSSNYLDIYWDNYFHINFKNDLGVTTLKKDPEAHTTLIGSVAKGIPGTDILETGKVQTTKDSTENAVHN